MTSGMRPLPLGMPPLPTFAASDLRCRIVGGVIELSPKRHQLAVWKAEDPDWPVLGPDGRVVTLDTDEGGISSCAYNRGGECNMTDYCELHDIAMCADCERHLL